MKGDLFRGICQWEMISTNKKLKNRVVKLPCFYYDYSAMTAIYTASTGLVRPYLPDPRMHPLESKPGRCLVAFSAFEYRKTDIDAYNEFSIAFLISFGKRTIPALSLIRQNYRKCFDMYIRHLPVTTEIARIGGTDLYGFPKIIAGIDITRANGTSRCVISEKKKHILTMSGPMLPAKSGDRVRYRMFTVRNGITLFCRVNILNHETAETHDTKNVVLDLSGDHPICSEMKSIDLSEKAVMYRYTPSAESILFGPRNLADD